MFHQESDQVTRSNLLLREFDWMLCISGLGESAVKWSKVGELGLAATHCP